MLFTLAGTGAQLIHIFLTCEAESLADWLEGIGNGGSVEDEESFLEPNLRFELRSNGARQLRECPSGKCGPALNASIHARIGVFSGLFSCGQIVDRINSTERC